MNMNSLGIAKIILSILEEHIAFSKYKRGLKCNNTPFITPSKNAFGFYALCQTKDQSMVVKL